MHVYSRLTLIATGKFSSFTLEFILISQCTFCRTNYTRNQWYYNAGKVPSLILNKHKSLAHAVKKEFCTEVSIVGALYKKYWKDWKKVDAVHLLINHRHYLDKNSTIKEFNEENIKTYNFTYGFMARDVLDRMKILYF
jgi:hypothetical protein